MKRLAVFIILCAALCLGCAWAEDYEWRALDDGTAEITRYTGTDDAVAVPETIGGHRVTRIAAWAFEKCGVTSVKLPEGVTAVGDFCFSECRALETVRLPDTLKELGTCAFMLCTAMETAAIPDGLETIGDNPFCYCTGLTELVLAEDHALLSLLDGALYDKPGRRLVCRLCAWEGEDFAVSEGCEVISDYALADCNGLASVELPASVTTIGAYAFYHCTALRRVTLPASVTEIGEGCFDRCVGVRLDAPEGSAARAWAEEHGLAAVDPEDVPSLEETDD